ncbi:MAG: sigma-54-dependent Fis family transcriptional regulator [Desulfovibrio desulfuricans]|nr:sigma-54-dependent Fis family transcriptional regulator [Desulfovibrio desulfuricans]
MDAHGLGDPSLAVGRVVHHLAGIVAGKMDRNAFFQVLAQQLRHIFHYDRFCINLYDAEREFLNLFTAADGTVVESLSNTRVARNTVAGLAIASRKPVVINDIRSQNLGNAPMPLSSVGLNATIALPLIFNREIMATLHVSFVRQPDNVVEILNFLLELSPVVTTFLFAVLAEERWERGEEARNAATGDRVERFGLTLEDHLLDTPQMQNAMKVAAKVAKFNIPVLITGETGTGKSMLARWLHDHSPRHRENFIHVNCPSLAPSLFESEMFGYAKGAFTGATAKRTGRIELAQRGTLFLDEIGELGTEMQSKLLQVLEENSFERVGEAVPVGVDIRVISATNRDLAAAMSEGLLRRDLYYRLAAVVIRMPALRERRDDIPLFVEHFSQQFARQYEIHPPKLSRSVINALYEHAWPGNIRELRNIVNRILLHSLDSSVTNSFVADMLHAWDEHSSGDTSAKAGSATSCQSATDAMTLRENEREHILAVLRQCAWRISGPDGAATLLGVPRSTLQNKMRRLGIKRHRK